MKVLVGSLAVVVLLFAVIGAYDTFHHNVASRGITHHTGSLGSHVAPRVASTMEPEPMYTSGTSTPSFVACAQEIYADAYGPRDKNGNPLHWASEHPDNENDPTPCGAYGADFRAKYPSAFAFSGNHPCGGLDTSTPTPECRWGGGPDLDNKAEAIAMAHWTPTASDNGTESYADRAADGARRAAEDYVAPSASATSTSFDYETAQKKLLTALNYDLGANAVELEGVSWAPDGITVTTRADFSNLPPGAYLELTNDISSDGMHIWQNITGRDDWYNTPYVVISPSGAVEASGRV
jgi:hypothetical protein